MNDVQRGAGVVIVMFSAALPGAGACGSSGSNGGSASTGPNVQQTGSGSTATGLPPEGGLCGAAMGQLFPPGSPWNTPVDAAALDVDSSAIIAYLDRVHTASVRFQIDFSIKVLAADATTPHRTFSPTDDFYEGDCDTAPIPVPPGGSLEGESGYACEDDGDCHLIVLDTSTCRLHEMWRANIVGADFNGGCQAVWDLKQSYPPTMRGEFCTSADAAGLPIAAHLFSADEVKRGVIDHAIRFILPNDLIRDDTYVHPATHGTRPTSGPASAPPYGARLRLKANASLDGLNPAAQVVARALQKYGMILSDGGNLTFTGMADDYTTAKWSEVGLAPGDLKALRWSDFEVVDGGARIHLDDGSCERTVITK